MAKIGIFYGPEKGSVDRVAHLIGQTFGNEKVELLSVKKLDSSALDKYDKIIFGASTIGMTNWDSDYESNDWDVFATKLEKVNWKGKDVAIFSLGDQLTYPEHFVDAIGWLHDRIKPLGANVVGFCSPEGYNFTESEGYRNGMFLGLPIDEDTEAEKTPIRVQNWVNLLISEYGY